MAIGVCSSKLRICSMKCPSIADRASRKLLRRWARLDLIVVDELGYLNLRPEQTNLFFKLMEERYRRDRKSTRLNSSHQIISYAVFCLKKKIPSTNLD